MKKLVWDGHSNRKRPMNSPHQSGVLSLDEARRAHNALLFLAATMGGKNGKRPRLVGRPVPHMRYFQRPDVDIAIVRGAEPPVRDMVDWVRRRQTTCMIGRLWDRKPFAELVLTVFLSDAHTGPNSGRGVAALDNELHLFTPDGDRWWLAGRLEDPLLFALTRDGPVPTLAKPFRNEDELVRGKTSADKLLSAALWGESAR
jgi:hypothetical protein